MRADKDGFCPTCRANADVGEMTQQPNVGVAPITSDVAAGADASTGYEQPPSMMPVGNIPVSTGGEEPVAVTPQQGNEAYQQGLPPTGTGDNHATENDGA